MKTKPRFSPASHCVSHTKLIWFLYALVALIIPALSADDYEVAVEDSMLRVRLDAPYQGFGCCEDGALPTRPHRKSLPDAPFTVPIPVPGEFQRQAEISAASGEAESFQIVIMPNNTSLSQITLSATPLKNGNNVINADQISFNQVGYVNTRNPSYAVERTGWFADPLLDPQRFDVQPNDVQPVWITIRVPKNTPAGQYTGVITVQPAKFPAKIIPVRLKVRNFSIPVTNGTLKLAMTWSEDASRDIHGKTIWEAQGLKRRYVDMLLAHRIGPDNTYRGSPPSWEDIQYAAANGASAINLINVGWPVSFTDAQIENILNKIEPIWQQMQAAGIADKAYVYGFDETYHENAIKQIYGAIGKRFPGLKRAVSIGWRGHEAVIDDVDIWSMSTGTYWNNFSKQEEMLEKLRAKGQQLWMYLSSSSTPPRPNIWIENALIESRSLGWILYMHDADGMLYYFINLHEHGRPKPIDVNAGPRTAWNPNSFQSMNGDGHLIYAGSQGPLASVRLANIRDAIEDYEYLKTLERLVLKKGMAKTEQEARAWVKDNFVKYVTVNFWIHTHEPVLLRMMRDKVAEQIEKLQSGGINWQMPACVAAGEPMVIENITFDSSHGMPLKAAVRVLMPGTDEYQTFPINIQKNTGSRVIVPGDMTTNGPLKFYFDVIFADGTRMQAPEGGIQNPAVFVPDQMPPSPIFNPAVVNAGSYQVKIKWDAAKDDCGIQAYEVHCGLSPNFSLTSSTLKAKLSASELDYTDFSPNPGQINYYAILAVDQAGRKGDPTHLTISVPEPSPALNELVLQAVPGFQSACLSWHGPLAPDVVAFEIERAEQKSGPFQSIQTIDNLQTTNYVDKTVQPNKTYFYSIRLRDRGGLRSAAGDPVAVTPASFVKRINCGGPALVPADGIAWEADNFNRHDGTGFITSRSAIANAGELQKIYATERWSYKQLKYEFDVPPGSYTVFLHFAETNPKLQKEGARRMTVMLNGQTVADNLDVFAEVGGYGALIRQFNTTVTETKLEIMLTGQPNGPMLKGLELLGGASAIEP